MNHAPFHSRLFLLLIISLQLSVLVYGQSKEELQKEKEKTLDDIKYTNQLLEETQQNRRTNLNRIRITNKRISLRNEVIGNINQQIVELEVRITGIQDLVAQMEKDYDKIKEEYKKMVYYTYWNRNDYKDIREKLTIKLLHLLVETEDEKLERQAKY